VDGTRLWLGIIKDKYMILQSFSTWIADREQNIPDLLHLEKHVSSIGFPDVPHSMDYGRWLKD